MKSSDDLTLLAALPERERVNWSWAQLVLIDNIMDLIKKNGLPDFDTDMPLMDTGLDSVGPERLINMVNNHFGISLSEAAIDRESNCCFYNEGTNLAYIVEKLFGLYNGEEVGYCLYAEEKLGKPHAAGNISFYLSPLNTFSKCF